MIQLSPEDRGLAHDVSGVMCDVCVCQALGGFSPLNSDGEVHTEVQMKAGGSWGHGQTVMKQQCDLQLAEQRSPYETYRTSTLLQFHI